MSNLVKFLESVVDSHGFNPLVIEIFSVLGVGVSAKFEHFFNTDRFFSVVFDHSLLLLVCD